jgi:hypothetical protein
MTPLCPIPRPTSVWSFVRSTILSKYKCICLGNYQYMRIIFIQVKVNIFL